MGPVRARSTAPGTRPGSYLCEWRHPGDSLLEAAVQDPGSLAQAAPGGSQQVRLHSVPRNASCQRQFVRAEPRVFNPLEVGRPPDRPPVESDHRIAHGRCPGESMMARGLRPVPWRACLLVFAVALVFRLGLVAATGYIHWFPRKEMV